MRKFSAGTALEKRWLEFSNPKTQMRMRPSKRLDHREDRVLTKIAGRARQFGKPPQRLRTYDQRFSQSIPPTPSGCERR